MNWWIILIVLLVLFSASFFLFIVFITHYSEKIILRWYKATRLENPVIIDAVQELAINTGFRPPSLYVVPSNMANAFTVGKGVKTASVVFTSKALEMLDNDELLSVFAHELYHINTNLRTRTVTAIFSGMIASIETIAFWGSLLLGFGQEDDPAPRFIKKIAASLAAPHASLIVNLFNGKKREYEADKFGAELRGGTEHLASSLNKIGSTPYDVNPGHAHLFFVNPLPHDTFNSLFDTHPNVEHRVKIITGVA
jgi:heat shock protein HtpX